MPGTDRSGKLLGEQGSQGGVSGANCNSVSSREGRPGPEPLSTANASRSWDEAQSGCGRAGARAKAAAGARGQEPQDAGERSQLQEFRKRVAAAQNQVQVSGQDPGCGGCSPAGWGPGIKA